MRTWSGWRRSRRGRRRASMLRTEEGAGEAAPGEVGGRARIRLKRISPRGFTVMIFGSSPAGGTAAGGDQQSRTGLELIIHSADLVDRIREDWREALALIDWVVVNATATICWDWLGKDPATSRHLACTNYATLKLICGSERCLTTTQAFIFLALGTTGGGTGKRHGRYSGGVTGLIWSKTVRRQPTWLWNWWWDALGCSSCIGARPLLLRPRDRGGRWLGSGGGAGRREAVPLGDDLW